LQSTRMASSDAYVYAMLAHLIWTRNMTEELSNDWSATPLGRTDPRVVTGLLNAAAQGERVAASQLLPLVYDELRKLAAARLAFEPPGQTLQATALVHEAYLRLVGNDPCQAFDGRGHFFAAAAAAMRRILVDRARNRRRQKRGGGHRRVQIDLAAILIEPPGDDLLALDEALESMAREDPLGAELVGLRTFAGLTLAEAAAVLGIGSRTADRYWAYARAWLCDALCGDSDPNPGFRKIPNPPGAVEGETEH
jgi:RNA polymerase sigma factor (TIGR02999 family)